MRNSWIAAVALIACHDPQVNPDRPTQSTSTLALSPDDTYLYAVDADSELLAVIDTRTDEKVAGVKVGAGAHLVTVGSDDVVYVANRYDPSISVVRRGEWTEAARWSAGLEPVGMATSRDGKRLYVVSAVANDTGAHGSLLALDTATGETKWTLALGEEPRSISLTDDGHAVVTLLKEGDVQFIDLVTPQVDVAKTDIFEQMNKTSLAQQGGGVDTQHPRGIVAVTASPTGDRVHAVGVIARQGPQNAWGGCAGTLLAAPVMLTFERDGTPNVDDVFQCNGGGDESVPRTVMVGPGADFNGANPNLIQGPSALAIERTGRWMFVAHQQTNNVALVSTVGTRTGNGGFFGGNLSVDAVVAVGRGPNGIVVTRQGERAYVLNAFDHTISVLSDDGNHRVVKKSDIAFGVDVLPADVVEGRKLFFDAVDSRMTSSTLGAACATCHLDNGREDGHVWTFAEGRRQTMSLAGGRLRGTEPFHWDGTLADMNVLMDTTTTERMGGKGPSHDMSRQVAAFIDALPAPVNPKQLLEPSEARARGAVVFQKAECGTCHSGEKLTNNAFAHVGTNETEVGEGSTFDPKTGQQVIVKAFPNDGINVPSLIGLARTAPYLHDGTARTLTERITLGKDSDTHGKTAQLSADEVADLVEFLEAL